MFGGMDDGILCEVGLPRVIVAVTVGTADGLGGLRFHTPGWVRKLAGGQEQGWEEIQGFHGQGGV